MIKLKIIALFFIVFASIGCNDNETDNVSSVTFFPEFTVLGDSPLLLDNQPSYVDPGVIVTENGQPIDHVTSVNGDYQGGSTIDTAVPDRYNVTYSATNVDGFSGSAIRTVWVYNTGDLVSSIEGLYKSTITRNGTTSAPYNQREYILIWEISDGVYGISDAIGGYYEYGRGYGINYAAQGLVITANDITTNNFSFNGPIGVGAFGGDLDALSMSVDATNKTIDLSTNWSFGYVFDVHLEQVQ